MQQQTCYYGMIITQRAEFQSVHYAVFCSEKKIERFCSLSLQMLSCQYDLDSLQDADVLVTRLSKYKGEDREEGGDEVLFFCFFNFGRRQPHEVGKA